MNIENVTLSCCLGSRHNQVLEESFKVSLERSYSFGPGLVLKSRYIEEVVEAKTTFGELYFAHGSHIVGERNLLFVDRSTEGPHECEGEETFVNNFKFFVIIFGRFPETL